MDTSSTTVWRGRSVLAAAPEGKPTTDTPWIAMVTHKSLVDVYAAELTKLLGIEVMVVQALPSVVESVADPQLREMLAESAAHAQHRADSITHILQRLGRDPEAADSPAMSALLQDVKEVASCASDGRVYAPADMRIRDAALIAVWRKIEHHRIAGYACTSALAEVGDDDADTEVLRSSLREIREEDDDVADLADSIINVQAPW